MKSFLSKVHERRFR